MAVCLVIQQYSTLIKTPDILLFFPAHAKPEILRGVYVSLL